MKTILVSGASGIVGYGVLKSLRQSNEKYKLIGTTIYKDSIAHAFCDVFEQAPMTSDKNYINWLCNIIKKHNVDIIIPGIEADMFKWNDEKETLEKTGVKILLNNQNLIKLCSDKWAFYETLISANSELVIDSTLEGTFEELEQNFGLPFLLKPRKGFASKGIVKVDSKEIFAKFQHDLGPVLMAQQIVGNDKEEYTVSAFFNQESSLLCLMQLNRTLSKDGFTEKAEVVNIDIIKDAIEELAEIFKPIGPTNFQFRKHNNKFKILEINPRISSATSIRTAFGYNESVMSIDYFLDGISPCQPKIKQGRAVRYTEDYIFYDSNSI